MPRQIDNAHAIHLVETRTTAAQQRDAADAIVKNVSTQLMEMLAGADTDRHQLPNGTIISIVRQKDRSVIVAERLLGHGVAPHIIEDCTKLTPVAPFIRVDAPRAPADATAPTSAGNVDQPGTISDRPN